MSEPQHNFAVECEHEQAAAPSSRLDQVLAEQRRRWRSGERALVEQFRDANTSEPLAHSEMLDLIYNEILLREESGDQPQLEDYRKRFPELAQELAVQFEVERVLDSLALGESLHDTPTQIDSRVGFPKLPGYEILEVLGRGGMAVVYKARHIRLNRLVAVKMILAGVHADPAILARFRTEAKAVARLQHPNIVQVFEIGDLDRQPFMALEFVDASLAKRLGGTPRPARQAAQWLETLACAVEYAHQQGIVHRDLKPANVLTSRDGLLKITDFGMAKFVLDDAPSQTQSGAILGTPSYMSPEQAEGKKQVGPAADIYGLGAILYEVLTGRPPFVAPTTHETLNQVRFHDPAPLSRWRQDVPRDLETICLRCLQKDPRTRYPNAGELASDLGAFLAGEPIQSRPPNVWERLIRWTQRRPAEAVLVGTVLMILFGLVVGLFWSHALAVGAMAGLSLLIGSAWYSAQLHRALAEVTRQQVDAERSVERLRLLLDLTKRIVKTTDVDQLLRLLAETTARLANAEWATIYFLDRERRELWSKVMVNQGVGEIRLKVGEGIAGTVALTGETINLPDAYADPRFSRSVDRRTGQETRNLLTVPMTARTGEILGVFQVINKQNGPFDPADIEILSSLAASAATAVENMQREKGEPGA